jgi:hypothetical protein
MSTIGQLPIPAIGGVPLGRDGSEAAFAAASEIPRSKRGDSDQMPWRARFLRRRVVCRRDRRDYASRITRAIAFAIRSQSRVSTASCFRPAVVRR